MEKPARTGMLRMRLMAVPLLMALMLNVLVAWICVAWSPYREHTMPSERLAADGWPVETPEPDGRRGWWFTAWGFGVWESVPSGARGGDSGFNYWRGSHTPAYFRGGWPMWSLQSAVTSVDERTKWDLPPGEIVRRGLQTSWLPGWLHAREGRRLPLVPVWDGFVMNTLAYLMALAGIRWLWARLKMMKIHVTHLILISLVGLTGCVTMSADPRLVGTYVAEGKEALVFERNARVYHYRMGDGQQQPVRLGFVTRSVSSAPGTLSIVGPDTSPFVGTSFQVSEDFKVVTVRWGIMRGSYIPRETRFVRKGP